MASLLNTASRNNPQEALRVNVRVSLKMIELAGKVGVSRFVYGSSISAYGTMNRDKYGLVSEVEPAASTDVYGITKRYVEIVGVSIRRRTGLGFAALRLPIVIGAGVCSGASVWHGLLFEKPEVEKKIEVNIPFHPDETIALVHVEEVAKMIISVAMAEKVPDMIYNAPCENWRCGDLASYVQSLSEQHIITCGKEMVEGIPEAINSNLFTNTFDFNSLSLTERFRYCLEGK